MGYKIQCYAILGNKDTANKITESLQCNSYFDYHSLGQYSYDDQILTDITVNKLVKIKEIDHIYCCTSGLNDKELFEIVRLSEINRSKISLVIDYEELLHKESASKKKNRREIVKSEIYEQY